MCDEPPQTTSKAELHEKKIMLSVWWDWKGVVFFELLSRNQTISSDVYCRQLNKLNAAVKEKRPELVNRKGVIFHHDNATPHTSLAIRQKLLRLAWKVMLHPPYSPDHAPSNYYLFRSLQNSLNRKTFNDHVAVKSHLVQFLPIKTRSSMSVESWSYQKDGKKSLNKMEKISLIKFYSLYLRTFSWKSLFFRFLSNFVNKYFLPWSTKR